MEAVLLSWMLDRAWWAQKVMAAFAVDVASNFGVRGATARQAVMCRQWSTMCLPCL